MTKLGGEMQISRFISIGYLLKSRYIEKESIKTENFIEWYWQFHAKATIGHSREVEILFVSV